MTLKALSTALLRAEKKLGTEMFVRLQADASGSISNFADVDLFRFESFLELADWLRSPRIVEYDECGEERPQSGSVLIGQRLREISDAALASGTEVLSADEIRDRLDRK